MTSDLQRQKTACEVNVASARPVRRPLRWVGSVLVLILAAQLLYFFVSNPRFQWEVVASWFTAESVIRGVGMTLLLTLIAMVSGIALGTMLALARLSETPLLRNLAGVYVWLFRAIPELVQLLFWFNLAALLPRLSIGIPFGPDLISWETNEVITAFGAAILGLGLLEAAYMAEIIRAGLLSVDRGQHEAARALGMKPGYKLKRIVLPQAMRFIVPPTGNNIIRMVKGTSLVSVIGMSELLYSVQVVYARTYEPIPLLIVACLWYLIINSLLFIGQSSLERFYSRGSGSRSNVKVGRRWQLFRPMTKWG